MNIGIIGAILMLVVWAVGTLRFNVPGWFHLLLTFGTFLLVWRIVARDVPAAPAKDAPAPRK